MLEVSEENEIDEIKISTDTYSTDATNITNATSIVTTAMNSKIKDTITYNFVNGGGNTIYTLTQGLGSDGEYSIADVGTEAENVMIKGKTRSWISHK